jgi:uncharacterized protein YidB (DUF937 family)
MGLLDSVLGGALGALQGQVGGQGAAAGDLMGVVGSLLGGAGGQGGAGGLLALVQQFQQGGLGEVVQSWVGSGANLPISAEQLQSVLGGGTLGQLAQQAGLDQGALAGQLAQLLPQVVDKLTPGGQLPEGGADLGGLLGGLLGSLGQR